MKKLTSLLLASFTLLFTACGTYVAQTGMTEKKWLRKTDMRDLVYIEGTVKAYRSSGSYYYFKDGKLVKVSPSLLAADKL